MVEHCHDPPGHLVLPGELAPAHLPGTLETHRVPAGVLGGAVGAGWLAGGRGLDPGAGGRQGVGPDLPHLGHHQHGHHQAPGDHLAAFSVRVVAEEAKRTGGEGLDCSCSYHVTGQIAWLVSTGI